MIFFRIQKKSKNLIFLLRNTRILIFKGLVPKGHCSNLGQVNGPQYSNRQNILLIANAGNRPLTLRNRGAAGGAAAPPDFRNLCSTRRPDPDKYRDIHIPLHFRLLFQEEGIYQKKLYVKTFPFPSTHRGYQRYIGRKIQLII